MSLLVLDASVAAKWFLPRVGEPLADEALALLRRYAEGEIELIVPDLLLGRARQHPLESHPSGPHIRKGGDPSAGGYAAL